jgi:hypothetical protein
LLAHSTTDLHDNGACFRQLILIYTTSSFSNLYLGLLSSQLLSENEWKNWKKRKWTDLRKTAKPKAGLLLQQIIIIGSTFQACLST